MQNINCIIDNSINPDSNIVILDVDRTIINTTSWYQACITEDLLLSKENIKKFKMINDITFKNPNKENLKKFRKETLNLIEKKIDINFIKKIGPFNNSYIQLGDYTNIWRFYLAGKYTALNLVKIYDDAIKYIKYLSKYYGNNLKIIFLSSGYEPFIRGVVDGVIEKSNLEYLNYVVLGSKLKITKDSISEVYHISQSEKKKIVKHIIEIGGNICFLADDSNEDEELFNIVKNYGGISLNIKHIPNSQYSETWRLYLENNTPEQIKKKLKNDKLFFGINKEEIVLPDFLEKLSKHTNEIGITYISRSDFSFNLNQLKNKILDLKDRDIFQKNIDKLVFKKNDMVYLRGKAYYNWLPQYIFIDDRCIIERWKELQFISEICLNIINKYNILNMDLSFYEKVIIYSIIDHLLESMFFLLNLIEQNDMINNHLIEKTTHNYLIELIQTIMDFMYLFFYENNRMNELLKSILQSMEKLELTKKISDNIKVYKTMRGMDNNITIFKLIKSVADKINSYDVNIDYVISFPYGGITLGFAMKAYMNVILNKRTLPNLLNCHYSSKQKIRENRIEKDEDYSTFKFVPSFYNEFCIDIANGNKKILLLDNNVTTFKTVDLNKNFLKQIGNDVYAAVTEVNYDNIVNYLLEKKCEDLIPNWQKVLDFHVISEYITSFNTWNTSQKSKILNDIYCLDEPYDYQFNRLNINTSNFIFKICRIHNLPDLFSAVKNGYNMIGIHAVYPDRIKYLNNELKYQPYEFDLNYGEELPIALLEINSIRDMQKNIPKTLKQAILFERPLEINDMIKTCEIYNMPKDSMYIQLQHRTNMEYIKNIKKNLCKNIIVTIGLFQKDFKEYFWNIHDYLDEKCDFILIDFSKHQPDLINFSEEYKESLNRVAILNNVLKVIENNKIPIIIADDTSTIQMNNYLDIISNYKIKIKGIDMQNCVELKSNEQKYQKLLNDGNIYQAKIRKSPNLLKEWNEFIYKKN